MAKAAGISYMDAVNEFPFALGLQILHAECVMEGAIRRFSNEIGTPTKAEVLNQFQQIRQLWESQKSKSSQT